MNKKIPFLDLKISDEIDRKELLSAIDQVFCHGQLVLGPEVKQLEEKIATYCNKKYAIAVSSGSCALFLAFKALGIGPGDEVITTSLSWVATANAIALTGAKPIFADIDSDLNVSPKSVESLISSATKAILTVHYTGKISNVTELNKIAKKHNLYFIEDAAQAFGAKYNNLPAGSFGDLACFSMNPMKVLSACGEAGIIVTDSEDIKDKLISLRYNGTINKERCIEASINGRIDTIQAAILLKRLEKLDLIIKKRRMLANHYNDTLQDLRKVVKTPKEQKEEYDIYYTYIIQAENRDKLKDFLELKGIETKIQHPILMPQQTIYAQNRHAICNAETIVTKILCLPVHEKLNLNDIDYVSASIREFYSK